MAAARWIRGEKGIIYVEVDNTTVITSGGLVYLDTDDAKHISALGDSGTKAQNQETAMDFCLGIALRSHANGGGATRIPVATKGIWQMTCTSGTYEVGSLVGPEGTGTAEAVGVSDTVLVAVATTDLAVGRVTKRGTTITVVQFGLVSPYVWGGPHAQT